MSKVLTARLDSNKKEKEKQAAFAESQKEKIKKISRETQQINEKMETKIEESITETAQTCYNYMLTDENKERILNPIRAGHILDETYLEITREIKSRLRQYVAGFLKSNEVSTKFREIKDDLVAFYKAKCHEIDIENDWVDKLSNALENENYCSEDDTFFTSAVATRVALATTPIWVPLVIAGLAVGVAVSPIAYPAYKFLSRPDRKKKIVEKEYNDFKENTVRELVRDKLKETNGAILEQFMKVATPIIKRRLEVLDETTEELLKSCSELNEKCNIFEHHASQINTLKEKCHILQKQLN